MIAENWADAFLEEINGMNEGKLSKHDFHDCEENNIYLYFTDDQDKIKYIFETQNGSPNDL